MSRRVGPGGTRPCLAPRSRWRTVLRLPWQRCLHRRVFRSRRTPAKRARCLRLESIPRLRLQRRVRARSGVLPKGAAAHRSIRACVLGTTYAASQLAAHRRCLHPKRCGPTRGSHWPSDGESRRTRRGSWRRPRPSNASAGPRLECRLRTRRPPARFPACRSRFASHLRWTTLRLIARARSQAATVRVRGDGPWCWSSRNRQAPLAFVHGCRRAAHPNSREHGPCRLGSGLRPPARGWCCRDGRSETRHSRRARWEANSALWRTP